MHDTLQAGADEVMPIDLKACLPACRSMPSWSMARKRPCRSLRANSRAPLLVFSRMAKDSIFKVPLAEPDHNKLFQF